MIDFTEKPNYDISDLIEIMAILRSDGGCPWDREQTHDSIRANVIEEAYEVADAIDSGSADALKEELGDLLLQVVFHSRMEQESGGFDFDAVCDGVCKKLIYRHPHIFGNVSADTPDEVLKNWDALKSRRRSKRHLPIPCAVCRVPFRRLCARKRCKSARLVPDSTLPMLPRCMTRSPRKWSS